MQSVEKCNICSQTFQLEGHIPVKLPCSHNVCQQCFIYQLQNQQIIKCEKCKNQYKKQISEMGQMINYELLQQLSLLKQQEKQQKIIEDLKQLMQQYNNSRQIIIEQKKS